MVLIESKFGHIILNRKTICMGEDHIYLEHLFYL